MGLSGLPWMSRIWPSATVTIWPQPTAQYGQTLATSRPACTRAPFGDRSDDVPTRPQPAIWTAAAPVRAPVVSFRNCRRDREVDIEPSNRDRLHSYYDCRRSLILEI